MAAKLSNGHYRGRVRDPRTGRQIPIHEIIGGPRSYPTLKARDDARRKARDLLVNPAAHTTLARWWETWTRDPVWQRPAASTNIHNRERTTSFVRQHGHLPMSAVDDEIVRQWLAAGQRGSIPALRAMWNDAATAQAGRLVTANPFANLRLPKGRGRADQRPPDHGQIARLIAIADEATPPSFAAYLDVAVHEGMRPGELDALKWTDLDFTPGAETIDVQRQWNAKVRDFTPPKHDSYRLIAMTEPARQRLERLPRQGEYVFATLRDTHYTPSARCFHWNRVRCALGTPGLDLYLASRHHFTWYALNVLGVPDHLIGVHLGHKDGGGLVRERYGHPDLAIARQAIRDAYADQPPAPAVIAASRNRDA